MSNSQECVECQTDSVPQTQQTAESDIQQPVQDARNEAPADPLNPATFVPPSPLPTPTITIEFCDRVRSH